MNLLFLYLLTLFQHGIKDMEEQVVKELFPTYIQVWFESCKYDARLAYL